MIECCFDRHLGGFIDVIQGLPLLYFAAFSIFVSGNTVAIGYSL
jgi:hypothetical protein